MPLIPASPLTGGEATSDVESEFESEAAFRVWAERANLEYSLYRRAFIVAGPGITPVEEAKPGRPR